MKSKHFENIVFNTKGDLYREAEFTFKNRNFKAEIVYHPFGNGWEMQKLYHRSNNRYIEISYSEDNTALELMKYRIENVLGGVE